MLRSVIRRKDHTQDACGLRAVLRKHARTEFTTVICGDATVSDSLAREFCGYARARIREIRRAY